MTKNILVTGSSGFIGKLLVPHLQAQGHTIIAPTRADIGSIGPDTDWAIFLRKIDVVIHLAGRAHVMNEVAYDPLKLYRDVNSQGTANLANQAAMSGVKRFIFASSVKVMGKQSHRPLSPSDRPRPIDPYGQSKLEGEVALERIAPTMDKVILRLPLVYGPGVKGNFVNLMKLLQRTSLLPFGSIKNKRSIIYSGNLTSAIEKSLSIKPGVYLPSDQDDLSTPKLIKTLGDAMGCRPVMLPIPVFLLKLLGLFTGKTALIQRLTASLTVDGQLGDWVPPFSTKEGLIETANHFNIKEAG